MGRVSTHAARHCLWFMGQSSSGMYLKCIAMDLV